MTTMTQSDKDKLRERIRDRCEANAAAATAAEAKRRRSVKAAKIQQVIDRFKELEELYNDMEKLVGVDPEAPMFKVGYDLFNAYLDSVAENVGDQWTWLSWHVWENDCGANALEASWTENGEKITVSVRTPLQLVRVMEGHADR